MDILAGQTYYIFGAQSYFQPCAVDFLPLPNQVFGRTPQFRLSHGFKSEAINIDLAVGAMRPPQRDSSIPDGQGSLKISVNGWKGMHTPGSGGTAADALAIAVSGTVRRFKVDSFVPLPVSSATATGSAVAVDALLPIIPVVDSNHRGNALTLNGEFSKGTGYADQNRWSHRRSFVSRLPQPDGRHGAPMPPQAVQDIDQGMVTYDAMGVLHTINWQSFIAGISTTSPVGSGFRFGELYSGELEQHHRSHGGTGQHARKAGLQAGALLRLQHLRGHHAAGSRRRHVPLARSDLRR